MGTVGEAENTTQSETPGPEPQSEEVEVTTVHTVDTGEGVEEELVAEGEREQSLENEQTTS